MSPPRNQAFGVGGAGSAGPASGLKEASGGVSVCKFSGLRIKERKVPEALMDSYMQVLPCSQLRVLVSDPGSALMDSYMQVPSSSSSLLSLQVLEGP